VKIPTQWGVVTVRGEPQAAQECYRIALKPSCTRKSSRKNSQKNQVLTIKDTSTSKMETDQIVLNTLNPDRKVLIGSDVSHSIRMI